MPAGIAEVVNNFIDVQRERVEGPIRKVLDQRRDWPTGLREAMLYSVNAGGKRLRPILALTTVDLLGKYTENFGHLFAALEVIHTYSLIHDDLPCMDDDDLRRGQETCHVKFGEAPAVLAGDGLLTLAFELMTDPAFVEKFEAPNVVRALRELASAAGPAGMVGGQYYDITVSLPPSPDNVRKLHEMKTARLLAASVVLPAILSGSHDVLIDRLRKYGMLIGLAFQIADDLLNVEGDSEVTGKSSGTDAAKNKLTYPSVLGAEESRAAARKACNEAKLALQDFPPSRREPLERLADFIIDRVS